MLPRFSHVTKFVFLLVLAALLWQPGGSEALAESACSLPDVVFLGEGPGEYTLPDGYDTLIVKRFRPFSFGPVDGESVTLTEADNNSQGHIARVWAMTGDDVPPAHFGEKVELGEFAAGVTVRTVMIDDDDDGRLTRVVNESENVYTVLNPAMVQPIEFTTNHAGTYFVDSADSIAFWPVCVELVTPTPTATVTATNTPSPTATATASSTPPATVAATHTAVSTSTPTATQTATPEPSATPASTHTPTITLTPFVPSVTPGVTPTNPPTLTPTPTVTATPTDPPTVIDPEAEPSDQVIYLPYVVNRNIIVILGEGPNTP